MDPIQYHNCQMDQVHKKSPLHAKNYFRLGTFHAHGYTIRMSFDAMKGFKSRVSNREVISHQVELVAPFLNHQSISLEQLNQLSNRLHTGYSIRVIRLHEAQKFKVEFIPKLLGGGGVCSTQKATRPDSVDPPEVKAPSFKLQPEQRRPSYMVILLLQLGMIKFSMC